MTFDSNPTALLPDSNAASLTSRMTFFVDAGAGDDSNVGSFSDPFQTIGRAIMQAKHVEGKNVINVRPGTYHESLNINDYGGLKIRGLGDQPHDVIVRSDYESIALRIDGASWVGVENMMFTQGAEGIYANNVNDLKLYRVRSRNNMNDGLHARDVNYLNISYTNFLENGLTGAHIISSESVNIGHSYFDRNRANGMRLDQNDSVLLRHVKASGNGMLEDSDSEVAAVSIMGNGIAAFDNQDLVMRGGYFNENRFNGVELQRNENASLYSVHASSNEQHGIGGRNNQNVMIFNGLFAQNDGSGAWLQGTDLKEENALAAAANFNFNQSISVNGTRLWDNGDEGLTLVNHDQVNLRNLHVRRNRYDGVDVAYARRVWMRAINTMGNGDDGIDIDNSQYVTAIDNWSAANQGDGFDLDGGYMLNVLRGNYNNNQREGMNFNGEYNRNLKQADIKSAVARNNQGSGLSFDDVNYANVVGGYFANNYHGIELYNVGAFDAQFVGSRFNRYNGLYSNTGVSDDDNDNDNGEVTQHGSIAIRQSSFSDNEWNGILISSIGVIREYNGDAETAQHGGGSAYEFDVNFDRVVASRNQGSGVYFGSEKDDGRGTAAAFYERNPEIKLDVNFTQGSYSQNGVDGIRAENEQLFSNRTAVDARLNLDRTRVNGNDRYGLYVDNPYPSVNLYVNINRGWFNGNQRDGISVRTVKGGQRPFVDTAADANGHHEDESAWATMHAEGVVALGNGGNGLNLQVERMSIVPEAPQGEDSSEDYHADYVANIIGGGFHNNAQSGINISVLTDERNDGNAGSRIYLERVFAKRNGQNGLTVAGHVPNGYEGTAPRGIQLQMVRGVFNRNQGDGIHLMNLGWVYLDQTRGIGNKDDGFDGANLGVVDGDWTFVANDDEDFVLS